MVFGALKDKHFVLLLVYIALLPWAIQHAHPQDLNYLNFVSDGTQFAPKAEYDYIVIGGGTAGCPLAATLSQNYSVLLLERGGLAHTNPNVMNEERLINNILETNDKDSPAQAFTSEDGVLNFRGRALGGTSLINFGYYSRADQDFYKNSGINWDMSIVKEAYEWVEESVVFQPDHINSVQSSFKEALIESNVTPDNGFSVEHNVGTKISGSTFDNNGRRHPALELLNKANPNNLKVVVNAIVERVIFSSSTSSADISAVGVIYHDSTGKTYETRVAEKGEVILSAGALGSTQLMLLSGVGPRTYLSSLGISVVHDQPFVGQFMADNPRTTVTFAAPFAVPNAGARVVGITNDSYHFPLSGIVPFSSPVSSILFPYPFAPLNVSLVSLIAKVARPLSTGSLKLVSPTDVTVSPTVRFNYYTNPHDLSVCVNILRYSNVLSAPTTEKFKFEDPNGKKYFKIVGKPLPLNFSDNGEMEDYCRTTLATMYHYHGGCTMQKVVDTNFRVIGINALRVVDGSTFVDSPGTNPQATLMMLGRYVGLKIQEERTGVEKSI